MVSCKISNTRGVWLVIAERQTDNGAPNVDIHSCASCTFVPPKLILLKVCELTQGQKRQERSKMKREKKK